LMFCGFFAILEVYYVNRNLRKSVFGI